jgi:uncharacterized protein with von Willebrand factor type A (vWA) domain
VGGQDLKFGLRSVLCSSKDNWDLFEECFQTFWRGSEPVRLLNRKMRPKKEGPSGVGRRDSTSLMSSLISTGSSDDVSSEKDAALAVTGASARERLAKADVSNLPQNDMAMRTIFISFSGFG